MGVHPNGWFIMENPQKNGWWLGAPPFPETSIWILDQTPQLASCFDSFQMCQAGGDSIRHSGWYTVVVPTKKIEKCHICTYVYNVCNVCI